MAGLFAIAPRGQRAQRAQIVQVGRQGPPATVENFQDFITATGGRKLLRVGEQKCLKGGPFWVSTTLTDNAAIAADLTTGDKWDKRVQGHYSSSSNRLKAVLRLTGIGLYINDDLYHAETLALKQALDDEAYIRISRGPHTMDLPLRGRIMQPYSQFQYTQTAAADAERALAGGRAWMLERDYQIDLETDSMSLRVDNAINWAGGNIAAHTMLFGWIAPRDFAGTGVKDTDVCAQGTEGFILSSVGPVEHGQLTAIGVGGPQTMGAWAGLRL